jgi:hypothetical protein
MNNAFIHHTFVCPKVQLSINDDESVTFVLFFKENLKLETDFCAELKSQHLAYSTGEEKQIVIQAKYDQIPRFLQALGMVAKKIRNPRPASVLRDNSSAMFTRPSLGTSVRNFGLNI